MPSAETMGNVYSRMDAGTVREAIHQVYGGLKRNKALPDNRGIPVAIVDGHESHARCRRHCSGCLERTIHSERGDRLQYYHRQVTLLLVTGTTAMRLLKRVLADAFYARAPFFVLALLKDEPRNLYQDAVGLFASVPPVKGSFRSRDCL